MPVRGRQGAQASSQREPIRGEREQAARRSLRDQACLIMTFSGLLFIAIGRATVWSGEGLQSPPSLDIFPNATRLD